MLGFFFSFERKPRRKYGKKLIDTGVKTGTGAWKKASKRAIQKTARRNYRDCFKWIKQIKLF